MRMRMGMSMYVLTCKRVCVAKGMGPCGVVKGGEAAVENIDVGRESGGKESEALEVGVVPSLYSIR